MPGRRLDGLAAAQLAPDLRGQAVGLLAPDKDARPIGVIAAVAAIDVGAFGPLPREPHDLRDLRDLRNDLEAPAIALCPPVGEVLEAMRALPGCLLARMSGSGATCFGLFADGAAARRAAALLPAPWWREAGEPGTTPNAPAGPRSG